MDYAEFMRRRGIPYPSPLGGNASVEAGTVEVNETAPETSENADGLLLEDEALTDAAEPTGNRTRRKSSG